MTAIIRPVEAGDLARVAPLCGELGYPAEAGELVPRLAGLLGSSDNLALLAERGNEIAGVIHAGFLRMLIEEPQVIVLSLVVTESARGQNIGAKLLAAAEAWALSKGIRRIMVGSNVVRERAHRFYHANGYREIKRWCVLRKFL